MHLGVWKVFKKIQTRFINTRIERNQPLMTNPDLQQIDLHLRRNQILTRYSLLHGTCNPCWVWITNRFYKQNDDQPMKNQIVMIHQIPQPPVSNVTQISKGTIISSSNNSVLPPSSWNRPIKFAPGIQKPINNPWFAHLILVQLSTWPGILAPFSNDRSAVVHGSLNLTVLTYFWLSSQSFILIGRLV